jgi:hypothetical protein
VNRPPHRIRRLSVALGILAATLLSAGAASAGTGSEIEGVWSFNGGQVAVQRLSSGTYTGTVVAETKFAQCTHPVGQQIWTDITEQSDGSYHGLHQWYLANCQENPTLGPTAWRILEAAGGSHYLRVCFSHPGTSQPTIAANGDPKEESEYAAYGVTYGCDNSSPIAPLPVGPGSPGSSGKSGTGTTGKGAPSVDSLTLPSTKMCLSGRLFKIRLQNPKYDPFKTVTITYKGHKLATSKKGNYVVATIRLKGVSKLTVKISATTVLGHHLSARRTYHVCGKKGHKKRRKQG